MRKKFIPILILGALTFWVAPFGNIALSGRGNVSAKSSPKVNATPQTTTVPKPTGEKIPGKQGSKTPAATGMTDDSSDDTGARLSVFLILDR